MNKKALSATVNTMLLIGMTIAAGAIIWGVVGNMVTNKLDESASCYGIQGKILLNEEYTCYNESAKTLRFSISLKDVIPEEILIAAQTNNFSKVVTIPKNSSLVEDVVFYPTVGDGKVSLPEEDAGKSYTISNVEFKPIKIQLAPRISGTTCEVADTITPIIYCN